MKAKTVVISASSSNQVEINTWRESWVKKGHKVINWPKPIVNNFNKEYPKIHQDFYQSLIKTDTHFIFNYDKNGVRGYVGPGVFAELSFSLGLNFIRKNKVKVILYKMPSKDSLFYHDVKLWLSLNWISLYKNG